MNIAKLPVCNHCIHRAFTPAGVLLCEKEHETDKVVKEDDSCVDFDWDTNEQEP